MSEAALLDRVIASAWPSQVMEERHGWVVRQAAGVTRRANSVFVDGCPADLDAAIAEAAQFYEALDQPAVFLCSEAMTPDVVTDALWNRGLRPTASTWVLVTDDLTSTARSGSWTITTSAAPTDDWFRAYCAGAQEGRSSTEREILRRVLIDPSHPTAFVAVGAAGGDIIAVGQVVVVDGIASVQCLVTQPTERRRGAGRTVVEALIAEACGLGASQAIAAVMVENEPSLGLFEQLGFRRSHRYAYYA